MSSFDRRQVVIGSVVAGAAMLAPAAGFCAPSGSALPDDLGRFRNAVAITLLNGHDARRMAKALESRLGRCRARDARYGLFYALKLDGREGDETSGSLTARAPYNAEMTYALNDLQGGVVLTSGRVAAQGEDILARLADGLAERLVAASRVLPV